jgi:hypothetical protein
VTLHWFLALSGTPFSGTVTPRSGIAKVCEARSGFSFLSGLPSTIIVPPMIPSGRPQNGFRRPVAVSYCRIVIFTTELAGTRKIVECTHFPAGFFAR